MTDTDLRRLKKLLEVHEGNKKFPYVDSVGKITIGIGHNLTDLGLSQAQVCSLLDDDVKNTLDFLDSRCPWFNDLDSVRQIAIADMTFNLMGKLLDFKGMIAALVAKDWDGAADHLLGSLFARQVGQRAQDLARMIRTGI